MTDTLTTPTEPETPDPADPLAEGAADPPIDVLSFDGQRLDASDLVEMNIAKYVRTVLLSRALPDIRDGFKPVHRRIIYGMIDLGLRDTGGFSKCARSVGHILGHFHPHGDTSVYDAMVRLGQPFTLNVPLVSGQGNFGSPGPSAYSDRAAAYRYTEAKLSKAGTDFTADLHPEIVEYTPNFDEQKTEPVVIPVTFPNLLVNGVDGIGWGMATSIPMHNPGECIDAVLLLCDNPEASLAQIRKRILGPDYPTGGIIVAGESLDTAYETGRSTFKVQGKYHIADNGQRVVIDELPWGVSAEQIIAQIKKGADDRGKAAKITEVSSTEQPRNVSTQDAQSLEIRVKRGGNAQTLINQLLQHTALQETQSFNMVVLDGGQPRTVGLMRILTAFVQFRHEIVTNRFQRDRRVLIVRHRRLSAHRAAVDAIDKVVAIIKASYDDAESITEMRKVLKVKPYGSNKLEPIGDEEAQIILDMPLKRINGLNVKTLANEIRETEEKLAYIDEVLGDPTKLTGVVKDELREARKRHGYPRKTALAGVDQAVVADVGGRAVVAAEMPKADVRVWATSAGYATARPLDAKSKDAPINLGPGHQIVAMLATDTHSTLLAFTKLGRVMRIRVADIPVETRKGKGLSLIALDRGDTLVALLPDVLDDTRAVALITARGEIKRFGDSAVRNANTAPSAAISLNSGDTVIAAVDHPAEGGDLLVATGDGMLLRTPLKQFRLVKGGDAGGNALIKLIDDIVVDACLLEGQDTLLTVHDTGAAKVVPMDDYPSKGKGARGVQSAKIDAPKNNPAGKVVFARPAAGPRAVIVSRLGQIVTLPIDPKDAATRAAASKPLFELGPGDLPALLFAG